MLRLFPHLLESMPSLSHPNHLLDVCGLPYTICYTHVWPPLCYFTSHAQHHLSAFGGMSQPVVVLSAPSLSFEPLAQEATQVSPWLLLLPPPLLPLLQQKWAGHHQIGSVECQHPQRSSVHASTTGHRPCIVTPSLLSPLLILDAPQPSSFRSCL